MNMIRPDSSVIRVGTRGSKLALTQTNQTAGRLQALFPGCTFETVIIKTKGDVILDAPLSKIGDKGLFTREIEEALLDRTIDLAVHSLKDLPGQLPEGLAIGAVPEREDPRDAFISVRHASLGDLPAAARVGTSSLRRRSQLLHLFPGLQIGDLRGNVDTRLRKLQEGLYDAILLASAGLHRLGLNRVITGYLPVEVMIPAAGQGALAVEIRAGDRRIANMAETIHHLPAYFAVLAERTLLAELEAGCQVPLGVHAFHQDQVLHMISMIASLDGSRLLRERISFEPSAAGAAEAGRRLAGRLLAAGAGRILEEIRRNGSCP